MDVLEARMLAAYSITALPFVPADLNDAGIVVGYANGNAYSWDGDATVIGSGAAYGINASGTIVGVTDVGRVQRAAVWDGGTVELLHPAAEDNSRAVAVNDAGTVVGQSYGNVSWATQWTGLLTNTLGNKYATVFDVNGNGQAVGVNGVPINAVGALWQDGETIELGSLGWQGSVATAINDAAHIVGWSHVLYQYNAEWSVSVAHPFRWIDGVMSDLGTLPCQEKGAAAYAVAKDVNDSGVIVGFSGCVELFHDAIDTAAIWDGGWRALTSPGWKLDSAVAVNNRGQIIGVGIHEGQPSGYLLTPIFIDPEYGRKLAEAMRL